MAKIKAFAPLRYTEKAGKIENNVCPPYDIVDQEKRTALCEKSPYNLIRLELPEGVEKYKGAAKLLKEMIAAGVLAKDNEPGIFIYEESFSYKGEEKTFDSLVCLCKTYDFSENIVLPHEETLSKAKKDRFDLMAETFCNFSSVYSLYTDEDGLLRGVITARKASAPLYRFTDDENVTHRMWKISEKAQIAAIEAFFAPKKLYIADGHHRYETAGTFHKYCTENNIGADSGYVMMTLADMEDPGLLVLPTHRLIVNMEVDPLSLCEKAKGDFDIAFYDDFSRCEEVLEGVKDQNAFALYTGTKGFWLFVLKNPKRTGEESAVKALDVTVLHDMILEKILGIDKANMAFQKNLVYTRDSGEAKAKVDQGGASGVFILNPTKVSQIKNVAAEGSKMPQKSTYFYPKLISGLLINQFGTGENLSNENA